MSTAKLFTHRSSQAVRLRKDLRLEGTEAHVQRVGDEVVLSALPPARVQTLIDALAAFEPGLRLQRERPEADARAAIAPRR